MVSFIIQALKYMSEDRSQGIHMWSFDGLPDVYGQWDLDESPQGIRCSRLGSSVGLLRPARKPRRQNRNESKTLKSHESYEVTSYQLPYAC